MVASAYSCPEMALCLVFFGTSSKPSGLEWRKCRATILKKSPAPKSAKYALGLGVPVRGGKKLVKANVSKTLSNVKMQDFTVFPGLGRLADSEISSKARNP